MYLALKLKAECTRGAPYQVRPQSYLNLADQWALFKPGGVYHAQYITTGVAWLKFSVAPTMFADVNAPSGRFFSSHNLLKQNLLWGNVSLSSLWAFSLGPTTNFETMILKFHELLNDLIVSDASDGEKPISSKQIAKIVLFNWSKQVWFGFIVLELVVGSVELWTLLFTIFFSNLEACKTHHL